MKEEFRKRETGITLVALVVTIVVLLILAGITIMYTMSGNGIFNKAQDAKNKTEEAIKNEQEYMNKVTNMINEYVLEEEPIENVKSDWETIEKIAKEIAKNDDITSEDEKITVVIDDKKYIIRVGDIFEVKYEGEIKRVRVLGFKHDDLVDTTVYGGNNSKASISFEFLDFMTGENYMLMNTTSTNENGWGATQMRKELNGYVNGDAEQRGTIGGLGANLNNKSYIKQVKKKYIETYNDANSVTTCNDYLWLLASSEVLPKNDENDNNSRYGVAITSEGNQYKYYQGVTEKCDKASEKRVKKTNELGKAWYWWLRSPLSTNSNYFSNISENGYATSYGLAYNRDGVAPGFCI